MANPYNVVLQLKALQFTSAYIKSIETRMVNHFINVIIYTKHVTKMYKKSHFICLFIFQKVSVQFFSPLAICEVTVWILIPILKVGPISAASYLYICSKTLGQIQSQGWPDSTLKFADGNILSMFLFCYS